MINEVDEALRALMKAEVAGGADIEVVFDAPTREWASTRQKATIDLYLYDIREDLQRRQTGVVDRRNEQGIVDGRLDLPRFYELAYLITAWAERPEDEHCLLSAALACCMVHDTVPANVMPPLLVELGLPLGLQVAHRRTESGNGSDVWPSLGTDLKASVNLVVTLPIRPSTFYEVAQLVMEPLRLHTFARGAVLADDGVKQLRAGESEVASNSATVPDGETGKAQRSPRAGRARAR